mgnify:CR=1 FL=1
MTGTYVVYLVNALITIGIGAAVFGFVRGGSRKGRLP